MAQPNILLVDDDLSTVRLMLGILAGLCPLRFATSGADVFSVMSGARATC